MLCVCVCERVCVYVRVCLCVRFLPVNLSECVSLYVQCLSDFSLHHRGRTCLSQLQLVLFSFSPGKTILRRFCQQLRTL